MMPHISKAKIDGEKRCKGCGVVKPLTAFPKYLKKGYTCHHSKCEPCYLKSMREYGRANSSRRTAISREWDNNNRERRREIDRAYRARNAEKIKERQARYRKEHPEKKAESENLRRALRSNSPQVEKINRNAIIQRDNATCYLCKRQLPVWAITLDHVVPLAKGGSHTADNLRVACRSCNSSKGARPLDEVAVKLLTRS